MTLDEVQAQTERCWYCLLDDGRAPSTAAPVEFVVTLVDSLGTPQITAYVCSAHKGPAEYVGADYPHLTMTVDAA